MNKFIKSLLSVNGEISSKRLVGVLIVITSLGWGTWFIIEKEVRDESAKSLIEWCLSAGVLLLGGSAIVDKYKTTKEE